MRVWLSNGLDLVGGVHFRWPPTGSHVDGIGYTRNDILCRYRLGVGYTRLYRVYREGIGRLQTLTVSSKGKDVLTSEDVLKAGTL